MLRNTLIDEVLKYVRDLNAKILEAIRNEGYTDRVRVAREYFVDAIHLMLDKKLEEAAQKLRKARDLLEGI
ncbi:MAG: hypothetical protein GXO23_00745 [Crenarchaeota archaeon]|nr:hypothetical protein [Thermoproteota archaeon]